MPVPPAPPPLPPLPSLAALKALCESLEKRNTPSCTLTLKAAGDDDQIEVALQGCCDTTFKGRDFSIDFPETGSLKATAECHQVKIEGTYLKATADRVIKTSPSNTLTLEGKVAVEYHKNGSKADIEAERVVIGLTDGRLEVQTTTVAQKDE